MHNGENLNSNRRRRVVAAVFALTIAGTLTACTPAQKSGTDAAETRPSTPAVKTFGPDGYGKLTIGITEKDALATGDLQNAPVSTVLGRKVYSFVDGPKPDAGRMAADEKIEKAVEKAKAGGSDKSAKELADDAQAYADSTKRLSERLTAFLSAGGAGFVEGELNTIAAPEGAATEAGIKRGSSEAELKAAYEGKGLKPEGKTAFVLPLAGHSGWIILFDMDGGTVRYMSLGGPN